jgi:LPS sulfotransferase NodH
MTNYVICSVPRSGSTLLARALADMGVGAPDEFLNVTRPVDGHGLVEREGLPHCRSDDDLRAYCDGLRARYTVGGMFGLKTHYPQLAAYPYVLNNLETLFPDLRFIAITRRDTLRQAVSFVRAWQTIQWTSTLPAQNEPWYDKTAIDRFLGDVAAQARSWEAFFQARSIWPLRIVYEDFAKSYRRTLTAVLGYLGVAERPIPPAPLERQADALTEAWVRRYRAESPSRWRRLFRKAALRSVSANSTEAA